MSVVVEGATPSERSQWHRIHNAAHAHGETVTAVMQEEIAAKEDEKKRVTARARGALTKHPRERKRQADAQGKRHKRASASDRGQDASQRAVRLDRGGRRQVELVPEVPEEPDDWARLQMMRHQDSQQVPRRHERHRRLKDRDQRPMSGRKASASLPRKKETKRSSKIPVKAMM